MKPIGDRLLTTGLDRIAALDAVSALIAEDAARQVDAMVEGGWDRRDAEEAVVGWWSAFGSNAATEGVDAARWRAA